MHTVRNRLAQNPRSGGKPAPQRTSREDVTFMLRNGAPPQTFPADLIVPPHRGSVIKDAAWPAESLPALAEPPVATPHPKPATRPMSRKAARKAQRRAAAMARSQQAAAHSKAVTVKQAEPANLPQPVKVDHVLVCEAPQAAPVPAAPVARVGVSAPVANVVPSPEAPLPAARALVARRQGFIDILAFALRDSGRRLARWSSARRRADDMKEKLIRAEARMRAMEAQLAALQAIQQRVRSINP